MRLSWMGSVVVCVGCGPTVAVSGADSSTGGSSGTGTTGTPPSTSVGGSQGDPTGDVLDGGDFGDFGGLPDFGDGIATDRLDVLFVVDNSASMARPQLALTRAAIGWVNVVRYSYPKLDVQLMVTTTDVGNPSCTPFQPAGYEPAMGAPTSTGCNARIADFTGLGSDPEVVPDTCTSVCPSDVVPDDPFVQFGPDGTNVPDVPEVDVDGDGGPDSAAAQALACLLPQGIDGCGYEAPLEAMLQALDPAAAWNSGKRPFLRHESNLAIVVLTDEADCSIEDFSIMEDPSWWNVNPSTGSPAPSSALCWNAGVTCEPADASGIYANCEPVAGPLHDVDRYIGYLRDELAENQGKRVDVFAIAGVPPVLAHNLEPPFQPIAGGVISLVNREWIDGAFPGGDILPDEFDAGVDAADKTFELGIGPACTGIGAAGKYFSQAVPNTRLFSVCQGLDDFNATGAHCFIESICGDRYDDAFATLSGVLEPAPGPDSGG